MRFYTIRALKDSNPRHPVLETDVLPTELRTLILCFSMYFALRLFQSVEPLSYLKTHRFLEQLNQGRINCVLNVLICAFATHSPAAVLYGLSHRKPFGTGLRAAILFLYAPCACCISGSVFSFPFCLCLSFCSSWSCSFFLCTLHMQEQPFYRFYL